MRTTRAKDIAAAESAWGFLDAADHDPDFMDGFLRGCAHRDRQFIALLRRLLHEGGNQSPGLRKLIERVKAGEHVTP